MVASSYILFIHPLFLSPLAQIPGPKLAALTSLYLNYHYLQDGVVFIGNLHRKYGPIVRVGPNELDIDGPSHMQPIYGIRSNFRKPDSTGLFESHGHPCTFASITSQEHKSRRRLTAKIYSMSAVQNHKRLIN